MRNPVDMGLKLLYLMGNNTLQHKGHQHYKFQQHNMILQDTKSNLQRRLGSIPKQ